MYGFKSNQQNFKNPTNSVVIHQSLVLRSLVLGRILVYRNWSITISIQAIRVNTS